MLSEEENKNQFDSVIILDEAYLRITASYKTLLTKKHSFQHSTVLLIP